MTRVILEVVTAAICIAGYVWVLMALNCCKDCGHSRDEHIKSGCVECECKEWR